MFGRFGQRRQSTGQTEQTSQIRRQRQPSHGQTIEHVLKEIYSKGTPNADENKIKGLVAKTEKEILQKAKKFAKKVYDHYDSDEFVIEKGLMPSSDFAVDLVPSWNEKTNKLDLYFLEINREYGYSGLREIDPTKAIQVGVNKRLII